MIDRTALLAGLFLGSFAACAAYGQRVAEPPSDITASAENWGIDVLDLGYANAEEVAALLSEILPPGISVVPYYATNSLIFAGDRELLRALLGDAAEAGAQAEPTERPAAPAPDTDAGTMGASFIATAR